MAENSFPESYPPISPVFELENYADNAIISSFIELRRNSYLSPPMENITRRNPSDYDCSISNGEDIIIFPEFHGQEENE